MRRELLFAVSALVVLFNFANSASAEKRVALIVGNGAYAHAPRLPNPANDASDVDAALKKIGFDTVVGIDLDKAGMEEKTIEFARAARDADVALFYYSGHAMQFNGQNYLMPIDAELKDEADLRRLTLVDQIKGDLAEAKNLKILVLDACRDNPLAEELKRSIGRTRAANLSRGLAKIENIDGMIIAFSTGAGTRPPTVPAATALIPPPFSGTSRNPPRSPRYFKISPPRLTERPAANSSPNCRSPFMTSISLRNRPPGPPPRRILGRRKNSIFSRRTSRTSSGARNPILTRRHGHRSATPPVPPCWRNSSSNFPQACLPATRGRGLPNCRSVRLNCRNNSGSRRRRKRESARKPNARRRNAAAPKRSLCKRRAGFRRARAVGGTRRVIAELRLRESEPCRGTHDLQFVCPCALDRQLSALYVQRSGSRSVRNAQSSWLNRRNACGSNENCVEQRYRERIAELQGGDGSSAGTANPSFPCSKARQSAEIAICSSPLLADLDVQLSQLYLRVKGRGKHYAARQRSWVDRRNACGSDEACIEQRYREQIAYLQGVN